MKGNEMGKQEWLEAQEQLRNELDREPTGEEVDERSADILAAEIDAAYESR
jgi:hypothetical protein